MAVEPDIARTAALFGDPARAAMLTALLDQRPRSAGELAFLANISPQTASFHLAKLTSAELLAAERKGRNQLYRLASQAVAPAIESLAAVSPMCTRSEPMQGIALARTCYDHLAGSTAVMLHDALLESGRLARMGEKEYSITVKGSDWLSTIGVSLPGTATRSPLARPCLDWTERRPHLAGRLAARLLNVYFEQGWLVRIRDTRAVRITDRGYREFERHYRVNLRMVPPCLRP